MDTTGTFRTLHDRELSGRKAVAFVDAEFEVTFLITTNLERASPATKAFIP